MKKTISIILLAVIILTSLCSCTGKTKTDEKKEINYKKIEYTEDVITNNKSLYDTTSVNDIQLLIIPIKYVPNEKSIMFTNPQEACEFVETYNRVLPELFSLTYSDGIYNVVSYGNSLAFEEVNGKTLVVINEDSPFKNVSYVFDAYINDNNDVYVLLGEGMSSMFAFDDYNSCKEKLDEANALMYVYIFNNAEGLDFNNFYVMQK